MIATEIKNLIKTENLSPINRMYWDGGEFVIGGDNWSLSTLSSWRLVENEKIRCLILVDKGTDIIEILYKPRDIDFMWKSPLDFKQPSKIPITKENESGSFLDLYFGGWHEMLPNVYLPANYKGAEYGLHGEASMIPWNYEVVVDTPEEVTIKFFIRMYRAPLYVEKYLNIKSNNNYLSFKEDIINEV